MIDTIIQGDCREVLKRFEDNYFDAIITDPPAGIAFMGKDWDKDKGGRNEWIAWLSGIASECLRVVKPGGHALVWALPRTSHWTGMAWEDAGWEPRDKLAHVFGSGFPKSMDISKALDKMAGAEREVVGISPNSRFNNNKMYANGNGLRGHENYTGDPITVPATPAAIQWAGWGSALKPSHEDWWLFRKPLACKTIAENVLEWGCGGLNVDGSRIATSEIAQKVETSRPYDSKGIYSDWPGAKQDYNGNGATSQLGRFPANLIWSHSPLCKQTGESWDCHPSCPTWEFAKAGERKSGGTRGNGVNHRSEYSQQNSKEIIAYNRVAASDGSASRFFKSCSYTEEDIPAFAYYAKASRAERNSGLDGMPGKQVDAQNKLCGAVQYRNVCQVCGKILINSATECCGKSTTRVPTEKNLRQNNHPCVKPLSLMKYLCRLICPPSGLILDPFSGSGTTCLAAKSEGFHFVGIEREPEYVEIARRRIAALPTSLLRFAEKVKVTC